MHDNMTLVNIIRILFLLFCGNTLQVAADGCQISNVTFTSTESSISLYYCDEPAIICYYGDQKTWGIREGHTACKQLNYKGEWPIKQDMQEIDSISTLNNFDCNEGVYDLNNCEFEVTVACKEQAVAGIKCYNDFEVRLVGVATPNAGRVEVKYDDSWANVCYKTSESFSKEWSFTNAQVVCRELGFPGTMFAKQGGQGNGTRTHIVHGYSCKKEMLQRNVSLGDCYPDPPVPRAQDSISSCDLGTKVMGNEAVVICAVPGYIGCYDEDSTDVTHRETLTKMTINRCRHICRNSNYPYAMLHNGDTCSCANHLPDHSNRIDDDMCKQECNGEVFEICGDTTEISVYDVHSGICQDPLNNGDVYYFGDVFDAFECDPWMKPANATPIQCVMGSVPDQFVWNGTTSAICIVYNGTCQDPLNKGDVYYFGDVFNAFECDPGMEPVSNTAIQCVMGSDPGQFVWNGTTSVECIGEQALEDDNKGDNRYIIIGSVVGVVAIIILLGLVSFVVVYYKRKRGIYNVLEAAERARYSMDKSPNMPSEVNEQETRIALRNICRNGSQGQSSSQAPSEDKIDGTSDSTEASNLLPIVPKTPCNSDIDTTEQAMEEHDISATSEQGLLRVEKMGWEMQTTGGRLKVSAEYQSFSPKAKPNLQLIVRTPSGTNFSYEPRSHEKDKQNGAISEDRQIDSRQPVKQIEQNNISSN